MVIKQQIERIRAYMLRPEINLSEVARIAGVHRNTLAAAKKPDWNPGANTLIALERFVDGGEPQ